MTGFTGGLPTFLAPCAAAAGNGWYAHSPGLTETLGAALGVAAGVEDAAAVVVFFAGPFMAKAMAPLPPAITTTATTVPMIFIRRALACRIARRCNWRS